MTNEYRDRGEMDEGQAESQFVLASGDATELEEFAEMVFEAVTSLNGA